MKKIRFLLGTVFLLAFTAQAQAALVTDWKYSVTSWFSAADTTYSSTNPYQSSQLSTLTWGENGKGNKSSLEVNGSSNTAPNAKASVTGTVATDGTYANSISLTHINTAIDAKSPTLTATRLYTDVSLTDAATGTQRSFEFYFDIKFTETDNNNSYYPKDIFAVTNASFPNMDFEYDGYAYNVVLGILTDKTFSNFPTIDDASFNVATGWQWESYTDDRGYTRQRKVPTYTAMDGYATHFGLLDANGNPLPGFTTDEGKTTTKQFAFMITSEPLNTATPAAATPEPSTLLLLGFGMVGLAGIARRKLNRNK